MMIGDQTTPKSENGARYVWVSIDSGSDADGCPTSFGHSADDVAGSKPVELRTATNSKIADLGERQVGLAFLGESGDEVMATNKFRLGDFNKPVLSCGVRVLRGATIHLELGNSYMQAPVQTSGKQPARVPLTMVGRSFYARARVLEPGSSQHLRVGGVGDAAVAPDVPMHMSPSSQGAVRADVATGCPPVDGGIGRGWGMGNAQALSEEKREAESVCCTTDALSRQSGVGVEVPLGGDQAAGCGQRSGLQHEGRPLGEASQVRGAA